MGNRIAWGENIFMPELSSFGKELKAVSAKPITGIFLVVYDSKQPWTTRHLREAQVILRKRQPSTASFHIVFVADAERTWQIYEDDPAILDELPSNGDSVMSLGRLHNEALRFWLEEQSEYSHCRGREQREEMGRITGNWPIFLERFHDFFISSGKHFDKAVENANKVWQEPKSMPITLDDLKLRVSDTHSVFWKVWLKLTCLMIFLNMRFLMP